MVRWVLQGADLQTAFANACNAMTAGEMAHAAGQFGLAFAGAEIALEMGVKKGKLCVLYSI